MALSECKVSIDSSGRERISHGTLDFPIACYHDDLGSQAVPWHWHEEWEAVLVTHGSALIRTDREQLVIRAGDGFFINAGVLHGCWNHGSEICRFHSLVFHPRLVGGSPDSVLMQNYVLPMQRCSAMRMVLLNRAVPWQQGALEAVEAAWQACVQEETGYQWEVRDALSRLTAALCRHMLVTQPETSGKAQRQGERVKQMLAYISEHLSEPLTADEIARSAAVSPSECLRCFHDVIGETPIQYVRKLRLQKAARLICETSTGIAAVLRCTVGGLR